MRRTAGEAGWHKSRYNIMSPAPDGNGFILVNLYKGTCACYSIPELYLYHEAENLSEDHPILKTFADRGLIVNFDELALLETRARVESGYTDTVSLTICPTMGCNFDCPYCFENHGSGAMSEKVQGDVVGLTERLLAATRAKKLTVVWFGGEPLLATKVIESLSERLIELSNSYHAEYRASIITNGFLLTQPVADLLGQCKVQQAQITLDGIGEEHDKTRHLADGGPTFDRITGNLRTLQLPFKVNIRHNVHQENRDQIKPLRTLVEDIARESGNEIVYYNAFVNSNRASEQRGSEVKILSGEPCGDIGAEEFAQKFEAAHAAFCGANRLFTVVIDDKGNLQKCWENADKPEQRFGTADRWDPSDPLFTTEYPDRLTCFMNSCVPLHDPECQDCVWLPMCAGGCPVRRLRHEKTCVPFKDDPDKYVLALYRRMKEGKAASTKSGV